MNKKLNESQVQDLVRSYAEAKGYFIQRNNVGAMIDKTGRSVRFGLCNDSKRLNSCLKSSDLIGIKKVLITEDMVGKYIGQYVAFEVKKEDWTYKNTEHEKSQKAYLDLIGSKGGLAKFVTCIDDID